MGWKVQLPTARNSPGSRKVLLLRSFQVASAESHSIVADEPWSWKSSRLGAEPNPRMHAERRTRAPASGMGVESVRLQGVDQRSVPVAASTLTRLAARCPPEMLY